MRKVLSVSILLLVPAVCAIAVPGDVDSAFNPDANRPVVGMAFEPEGTILIAGDFEFVGATGRSRLARLHANGILDTTFDAQITGIAGLDTVTALTDGRIIIGGDFTTVAGVTRNFLARVNPGGSLDAAFNPNPDTEVRTVAVQPDGRTVVAGSFLSIGGVSRNRIARLNADGSLDPGFNPNANALVRTPAIQPDGKIIIGGAFTTVGGVNRNLIARVNADGSVDTTFNPNVTGTAVYCVEVQAGGKILLGGLFTAVGGVSRTNLARLNPDGSVDTGFTASANDLVRSTVTQADGRVVIAGGFTSVNSTVRNRVARLNANGTLDLPFNPNANALIWGTAIGADGKVVIGGEFTTVGGALHNRFARLANDPATQSLTAPSPVRVQWLRGGTSPETQQVTFELSTIGGSAWNLLGSGSRIAGGWELSGISLPADGQIRARARITGGYANGSSGLVETVAPFSFTPQQLWRQTHFGSVANSGDAADEADPDSDGLANLIEFAFGLDPRRSDAASLPSWQHIDDDYVLTFTRPAEASGVTCVAEYSTSLNTKDWTAIPNSTVEPLHTFYAPAGFESRLYLRLCVIVR